MPTKASVRPLIDRLQMERHPEGGWFRETYRSGEAISAGALPKWFKGGRAFSTAIYFLLEKGDVSALHRIKSDELWHFYSGTSLAIHVFGPGGGYRLMQLGADLDKGENYQVVVEVGCWFGAEVTGDGDYALVGCTVAPGFDFRDFELGKRQELLAEYPEHEELIRQLTIGND